VYHKMNVTGEDFKWRWWHVTNGGVVGYTRGADVKPPPPGPQPK
jgi:hypothetical protein